MSSMAPKTTKSFILLAFMLAISFTPAKSDGFLEGLHETIQDKLQALRSRLFPAIEVTLANNGQHSIYFMCRYTDRDNSLYELRPNDTHRFSFRQVGFPMRWCYLYINKNSHGFFWAYNVRSRCTKCFWSIDKFPDLYRSDRGRWERQQLFVPVDFNPSSILKEVDEEEE